jgi:ribosome biogenesis GTPase
VLFADFDSIGYITDVLKRTNALSRRQAGTESAVQVLACNIDAALIVQGLDRDFNLMRLDRYIVQIIACGIRPVVILNKSDLVDNPENYVGEVSTLKRGYEVHVCSTLTRSGIDAIRSAVLERYKTYVIVGSSGAGKSSIVNALMSEEIQRTGTVSGFNQKGKHTTSTRDLFRLDNGSLIIDTPGMREFGMTSAPGADMADNFPAISEFASRCRFNDCTHTGESGCAVITAVNSGQLELMIYQSYLKLIKEQRRFAMSASDKKREGRRMGKMVREAKDYKKRFKGG